jgi:hypothetical protein
LSWRPLRQRRDCRAPKPVLLFDIGDDEFILGSKVLVECRLGHASFCDNAVDTDSMDAPLLEEPGRSVE